MPKNYPLTLQKSLKTNGQWQLFVYHVSPVPAGN